MADLSQLENMTASELLKISKDENQTKDMRAAANRELSKRSMGADKTKPLNQMNRGGDAKKKVPAIAISFGMVDAPKNGKNKAKMMRGGMANKREHMYATGGSVTDNAGLRALKKASPEAYKKITGK
jgi:ribosomal protein S8E